MSSPSPDFTALVDDTHWVRAGWRAHLAAMPRALGFDLGPHATDRFPSVGHVVRHVFGSQLRYVDRLRGDEPRDVDDVATDSVDALFALGDEAGRTFGEYVDRLPAAEWDRTVSLVIADHQFEGSVRTILLHVLTHEIRHWMQLGVVLRGNGCPVGMQDFIAAPTHGGTFVPR